VQRAEAVARHFEICRGPNSGKKKCKKLQGFSGLYIPVKVVFSIAVKVVFSVAQYPVFNEYTILQKFLA